MSEQEFENWLALLSGLLKLSPEQRQNISDELRSHLEERMEDLIDAGSSREEAIAAALAEFGDTAALAHHFTSIAHQKRRRRMRYTYGTIAAVTCAILVLATFWPQPEGPVLPNVVAQSGVVSQPGPSAVIQMVKESDSLEARNRVRIEAILAEPIPEIKFQQMPLREVLVELKDLTGIKMVFDPEELGDVIDPEAPMTVDMEENSVTYDTLIKEYLLEPHGLAFQIRHNSLLIMSYDKYLAYPDIQLVVYNCRDLLVGFPFPPATEVAGHHAEEEGTNSIEEASLEETGTAQPEPDTIPDIETREQQLADLIRSTVIHEDFPWADESNGPYDEQVATIQAYNGLLIIRNLPENHERVRQLLHLLRESMEQQSWPAELVN